MASNKSSKGKGKGKGNAAAAPLPNGITANGGGYYTVPGVGKVRGKANAIAAAQRASAGTGGAPYVTRKLALATAPVTVGGTTWPAPAPRTWQALVHGAPVVAVPATAAPASAGTPPVGANWYVAIVPAIGPQAGTLVYQWGNNFASAIAAMRGMAHAIAGGSKVASGKLVVQTTTAGRPTSKATAPVPKPTAVARTLNAANGGSGNGGAN